ncbi:unnamed protein product, partial [Rotaria sp. Silwood2]
MGKHAYGQDYISFRTGVDWIHRFSSERESLKYDPQTGGPITVITQQNIN